MAMNGALQVAVAVLALLPLDGAVGHELPDAGRGVGADHADFGAGVQQPGDLALGHRSAADDDAAPPAQVQVDRIVGRHL